MKLLPLVLLAVLEGAGAVDPGTYQHVPFDTFVGRSPPSGIPLLVSVPSGYQRIDPGPHGTDKHYW